MKEFYRLLNADEAFRMAAERLNLYFEESTDSPILFLSSGGSAIKLLDKIKNTYLKPTLTVGVLDERYSKDSAVNNFAQLEQTYFYTNAKEAGVHFIDTKILHNETGEEHAKRFMKALQKWKKANAEGTVIATMGIGPDGHTSGIMPYPEDEKLFYTLFDTEAVWVVHYNAGNKNPHKLRTTTTLPFIRNVLDKAVCLITGVEKKFALENMQKKEGSLAETPARIIEEMKEVSIYTDID